MNRTSANTLRYSRPLTPAFFAGASHDDIKWTINYLMTLLELSEKTDKSSVKQHSSWIESMAKFRRLEPVLDDRKALCASLDERYQ